MSNNCHVSSAADLTPHTLHRMVAESEVAPAEATQVDAEAVQIDAEAVQIDAEAAQVDAEAAQVDAEAVLVDAEAAQVDAEAVLVDAEAALMTSTEVFCRAFSGWDIKDLHGNIQSYFNAMIFDRKYDEEDIINLSRELTNLMGHLVEITQSFDELDRDRERKRCN